MSPREAETSLYLNSEPESSGSLTQVASKPQEQSDVYSERETTISFGSVSVREYNQIIGDHPEVRVGPPISLGWEYTQRVALSLDEYEETRPPKKVILRLSSITRKNLLHNVFGYTEEEIRSAEKEVQKIRKKRDQTLKQGKTGRAVETVMQAARRKLRRTLSKDSFIQGFSAASGMMSPFPIPMTV